MVELTDLEINVLEFRHKNFSFQRMVDWEGHELAVFHRRETENETKLRPKIVHLYLVVPREWILYDLAADLLVLGKDGHTPGPRPVGTATEAAAETREFREQGIDFQRTPAAESILYAPKEMADALASPEGRSALGWSAPP